MGFRDFECFNDDLLGKQCWRILKNPNLLVSRILQAKYFKNGSFLEVELGRCPSFLWCSIWQAKSLLCAGVRWKIGNGLSVKVTLGNWIPRPKTFMLSPFNCSLYDNLLVEDLIDMESFRWKTEMLISKVDSRDVEIIESIPISLQSRDDEWVCHYSSHGVYSVKSAYHIVV